MSNLENRRLLVVEDERDGQQVLADILEHYQIACDVAGTAEDGLRFLKSSPYDAVIIDLGLPGMNGFDLLARIRQNLQLLDLPCIAYTAYHSSKVRFEAMERGFNAYLRKPLRPELLIKTLRTVLIDHTPSEYATYDDIADDYAEMVSASLDDPDSILSLSSHFLLGMVGSTGGLDVCDLCCGEGHLTRHLMDHSRSITAIDSSSRLLDWARARTRSSHVQYVKDDAQHLTTQPDACFDLVVCNLALMDVPDIYALFKAVYRVLKPQGRFLFSVMHPCFQSPHAQVVLDEQEDLYFRQIAHYAREGQWMSDYSGGVRGRVGAYHRTLATYINTLLKASFNLQRVVEPTLPPGDYDSPAAYVQVNIPSLLLMEAVRG